MKENQVYKWFWEIQHKHEEEEGAEQISQGGISDLSNEKKFEVFVNRSLKHYRDSMQLKGVNGSGKRLSEDEIISSVKIYTSSKNKMSDFEILAQELDFDIEEAA